MAMFRWTREAARRSTNARSLRERYRANVQVEALEARDLMSAFIPSQIRSAYGFGSFQFVYKGQTTPADGRGQTIAIVDAYDDPKIFSDLAYFDSYFGIAAPPSFVKAYYTTTTNSGWATEEALDVEWAHAMAPQAKLLLVEAASSSYNDLFTAVNWARSQAGVSVVSMSWGGGEWSGETSYDQYMTTPHGHNGVTFVASSGDNGSGAIYPAASPNALSVGGTSLYLNSSNGYLSESGWSGSGGGVSSVEGKPSYQNAVQVSSHKTTPDVAYDANPNTGFWVYNTQGSSGWGVIGGTSAGAPQWAALVAIADEGRAIGGYNTLDGATQTLPALYGASQATDFHDVTTGSNGAYSAHGGYDLVTGLGSPKAQSVVNTLLAVSNASFVVLGGGTTTPAPTSGNASIQLTIGNQDSGKPAADAPMPGSETKEIRSQSTVATPARGVAFTSAVLAGINKSGTAMGQWQDGYSSGGDEDPSALDAVFATDWDLVGDAE
jgi:subtilase family serine protease